MEKVTAVIEKKDYVIEKKNINGGITRTEIKRCLKISNTNVITAALDNLGVQQIGTREVSLVGMRNGGRIARNFSSPTYDPDLINTLKSYISEHTVPHTTDTNKLQFKSKNGKAINYKKI